MTVSPEVIAQLQAALAAVPTARLTQGVVAGQSPGVLAGETPVCKLRGSPEGAAYGTLIVEAVNALPALIRVAQQAYSQPAEVSATPASSMESTLASNPQRAEVEAAIANALLMQNGFQRSMVTLWSRLVFAAIEPWIKGGREALDTREVIRQAPKPAQAGSEHGDRLDAVLSFCTFLMAQKDQDNLPNEHALEQLVNMWAASEKAAEAA